MGENTENLQGQNTAPAKEKLGCMGCIGVLLLLAAIGAAGWFFIAKTVLEEKGVDVDGKIEEIKAHSMDAIDKTKSKLNDTGENIAGKYSELKNTADKIAESETVEKIKSTADKVRKSETAAKITEKAGEISKDIAEKAENGGSWY